MLKKAIKLFLPYGIISLYRYIKYRNTVTSNETKLVKFIGNCLINLYPGCFGDDKLLNDGVYEENLVRIMKSVIPKDSVVFDIGANVGMHTILMSSIVGKCGHVFAFEPVSYNIKRLNTNITLSTCLSGGG